MTQNKKLFCERNALFYAVSVQKGVISRNISDIRSREKFAAEKAKTNLVFKIAEHKTGLIKRAPGIEPELQYNKAINVDIACRQINGILIRPGQTFSFWKTVGKPTRRKGYRDGRVILENKLRPGVGGGLCNLAHTINLMVLETPLTVSEFHTHSDALAPDGEKRIPFATGTSISYNYIDYRFKNQTNDTYQLNLRVEGEALYGEILCDKECAFIYDITEENHRFVKENGKFFRMSKIYRNTYDKNNKALLKKELLVDNHSEVMFDYSLIPENQIEDNHLFI